MSGRRVCHQAVRRERLIDAEGKNLLDSIDTTGTRSCPIRPAVHGGRWVRVARLDEILTRWVIQAGTGESRSSATLRRCCPT